MRAFQAMDRKLFAPLLRIDVPDREAAAATLRRIDAAKKASSRVTERVTAAIPASLRLRGGTGMEPASVVPTPANVYCPSPSLSAPLSVPLSVCLCVTYICPEQVQIFEEIDVDGSGTLSFEEFELWWTDRQRATTGRVDEHLLGMTQSDFPVICETTHQ